MVQHVQAGLVGHETVVARSVSNDTANNGSSTSQFDIDKGGLYERRLDILTQRLDAISNSMEKTSTGHFRRSLVAM
jgi:hypothetical protein